MNGGTCTCSVGVGATGLTIDRSRCPIHSPQANPIWKECPHCYGSGQVQVDDYRYSEPLLRLPSEPAS